MFFEASEKARKGQRVTVLALSGYQSRVMLTEINCLCNIEGVEPGDQVEIRPRVKSFGPENSSITHNIVAIIRDNENEPDLANEDGNTPPEDNEDSEDVSE